jgi:CheY-like chemotaxis protein
MDQHKPANILLVEDNQMDVVLTLDAFQEACLDNKVQVVRNGEYALKYVLGEDEYADRKKYPLPDLILLDLKLPGISGHDVLARLKSTPTLKRIPIVVLTSSKEEGDLEMSYDRGANSYLVKPITFDGFLETVREIGKYWLSLNVSPRL